MPRGGGRELPYIGVLACTKRWQIGHDTDRVRSTSATFLASGTIGYAMFSPDFLWRGVAGAGESGGARECSLSSLPLAGPQRLAAKLGEHRRGRASRAHDVNGSYLDREF